MTSKLRLLPSGFLLAALLSFPFQRQSFAAETLPPAIPIVSLDPDRPTGPVPFPEPPPSTILDLVGKRADKNSVGHGRNLALYTGEPSKFFFATHFLGNIFSATDGQTLEWFPDHVWVNASANTNSSNPLVVERRQVCITREDVIVARIHVANLSARAIRHRIEVTGDCRGSFDWREKPSGEKVTEQRGDAIVMVDHNVFPDFLPDGLFMIMAGQIPWKEIDTEIPGTYRAVYEIEVPAASQRSLTLACAVHPQESVAAQNLAAVLKQPDPMSDNRRNWERFFLEETPRFSSSDGGLDELYAFRWFLLRFSTAGGDLGYFKYPVVMEGRQAYQTYCCYSAPFMAFDLNWHVDPQAGFGHIANMVWSAYEDGRFPWYTSPRTNQVQLHHESRTGLSLLPHAAWKHYVIHGRKELLRKIYPGMKKNLEWWIQDRDPNQDGLFDVAHQYETGMDDLHRWGAESMAWRYDAVDATAYAIANLRALSNMASVLDESRDSDYFADYADKAARALNSILWDPKTESWRDRHPQTGQLAEVLAITTFYPFYAGAASPRQLGVIREHLLNPEEFFLPFPIPALAKNQRDFNPAGFWQGPSWPAATTHVLEAAANTVKQMDRARMGQVGELFRRAARIHLQPRADFHERYNPITGSPLSQFRDYMHSWWIDLIIRHVAGLMLEDSGEISIDPLPMGLDHFALQNVPVRGRRVDVFWRKPGLAGPLPGISQEQPWPVKAGLLVQLDGKTLIYRGRFQPGAEPVRFSVR